MKADSFVKVVFDHRNTLFSLLGGFETLQKIVEIVFDVAIKEFDP